MENREKDAKNKISCQNKTNKKNQKSTNTMSKN